MNAGLAVVGFLLSLPASAGTLRIDDGTTVSGTLISADAQSVEWDRCGVRTTYARSRVRGIEFEPTAPCVSDAVHATTLTPGTRLHVQLSASLDSANEPAGQVISGTMQEPVLDGAQLLIRAGAPVLLRLQIAPDRFGRPATTLQLTSVLRDRRWCVVDPALELADRREVVPEAGESIQVPSSATLVFSSKRPISLKTESP